MSPPDYSDKIISEILELLSFREKHFFAYMDESSADKLQYIFEKYIEGKWGLCVDGEDIIKRVWAELCKTHRLRIVGSHITD